MKTASGHSEPRKLRTPTGIVLLYALFSAIWIAASDRVLGLLINDAAQLARVGTYKGFLFIVVTASLLYLLLSTWYRSLSASIVTSNQLRQRLERVLQATNDGWWDWDLQQDQIYYSPRWWEILGYAVNELPADSALWRRMVHPDDVTTVDRSFREAQVQTAQGVSVELRLRHKDGHYLPILSRYWIQRGADGKAVRISGTNMDLTERTSANEQLRLASTVFETTREGVVITDAKQRIVMVNHAFTAITGYSVSEVAGQRPAVMRSGRHDDAFYVDMWSTVDDAGYWQGEVWARRKDGEIFPQLMTVSSVKDKSGAIANYVGVFADISRLKASETKLEFLANHDPVTHLPNRLLLLSHLEHGIRAAQRDKGRIALLMLDLDRFKDVNDSFGHDAGDALLKQVAERLTAHLRGMDTVARLGGDEFAVMLKGLAQPEDAALFANEIMASLNKAWTLPNGAQACVGVSIGISLYPDHGITTHELLQHADAAMYQAKNEGRGCFRYFSQNLTLAARERIDLEARLHRAIERDELRVFYQPQIDIASGRIVGAEALVRWQEPQEGLISPARFIPVAESTGLINDLGAWVLKQTCIQGRQWIDAGLPLLTLAVNISSRQFLRDDFGVMVSKALADTGFPATSLELELTESALMEREKDVVQLLNGLRSTGVRLAIDDFGTGYSSLAYLKRFPLDVLKIGKGFIDEVSQRQDGAIAAAIVAMGHSLGFKVLAEGVETDAQLAFLKSLGCDMFQGYLVSKPVPAREFEQLLRSVQPTQVV